MGDMLIPMKDYFQEVRKDERLRQPYLDKALALCPESVSEVVYDPEFYGANSYIMQLVEKGIVKKETLDCEPLNPQTTQFVVIATPSNIGTNEKHPVFVSYAAFKRLRKEKEFLNSLIDHEGLHCSDAMYGMSLEDGTVINQENINQLQYNTFMHMLEIRAYHNQIIQARKQDIQNRMFYKYSESSLDWEIDALHSIAPESELEKRIISDPCSLYFHLR
jgi:hypothetical protein